MGQILIPEIAELHHSIPSIPKRAQMEIDSHTVFWKKQHEALDIIKSGDERKSMQKVPQIIHFTKPKGGRTKRFVALGALLTKRVRKGTKRHLSSPRP